MSEHQCPRECHLIRLPRYHSSDGDRGDGRAATPTRGVTSPQLCLDDYPPIPLSGVVVGNFVELSEHDTPPFPSGLLSKRNPFRPVRLDLDGTKWYQVVLSDTKWYGAVLVVLSGTQWY